MTDDSMRVWYEPYENEENRILVQHYNPENTDDIVNQIQCDRNGVYHHIKENGSWRTVPHSIAVGGTGATSIEGLRKNLGLAYNSGATTTIGTAILHGYVTNNSKQLFLTINLGASTQYTPNISFTEFTGVIRGISGYLDNNNTARNLLASPFSVSNIYRPTYYELTAIIDKNAAFTNVTNNTPVNVYVSRLSIKFDA